MDVEDFNLEDHVISVALPAPGGKEQLEGLVGELSASPFNAVRPWWTFHLVEDYDQGSAIVARIHHCYADGIALIQVLLGMADDAPVNDTPPPRSRKSRRARSSSNAYRDGRGLLSSRAEHGGCGAVRVVQALKQRCSFHRY